MLPSALNLTSRECELLCQQIAPDQRPLLAFSQPEKGAAENECFELVADRIAREGGEAVTGWALWIYPSILAEGEYHQVWRRPDGLLIDLNPRPALPLKTISFLPDPSRPYKGRQIDNVRLPLSNVPGLRAFIACAERQFQILNTDDLANQHGEVYLSAELYREYLTLEDQKRRLAAQIFSERDF